ncbi:MAG: hypothetical protein HYX92_01165 [Chloroflexi bacterium]|nr:hypothetical protein [Chloroflexota bacterium]
MLEKAGKPTVGIVARGFETDAKMSARVFGLPDFRFAVVPHVLTSISPEQIEADVEEAFAQIIEALTTGVKKTDSVVSAAVEPATRERFRGSDRYEAFLKMNDAFLEREWADGFPLIPPTEESVQRMLRGATLDPEHQVSILTPGDGIATVEKLAINAVMAGCQPAHLPVLIAAVRAIEGMGLPARRMAMSTGPYCPLLLLNGPIVKELGVNTGRCTLGPGAQSRVNIVIGRALRLIMMNVGHAYPGHMDMDTIGTPRKFSLCTGEREEVSPWAPFHVEHGYPREASTVTIFHTHDEISINDLENWTPEGVLNSIAFFTAVPEAEHIQGKRAETPEERFGALVLLSPDHAKVCGDAGWSKKAVKDYIWQQSTSSAWRMMNKWRAHPITVLPQWRWLLELSRAEQENMMMPVLEAPEDYSIVVVGGSAGKDTVIRTASQFSIVEVTNRAAV